MGSSSRREARDDGGERTAWLPWAILAWALLGNALATWAVHQAVTTEERARLADVATAEQLRIEQRLQLYEAVLRGVAAQIQISDEHPDPVQFHAYIARLRLRELYPGFQGIGFAAYARRDEVPALEARWRAHTPTFHVWPASTGPHVTSIVMIEPPDRRNRAAIGFDGATNATRAAAMWGAVDTGHARASGRVTLVQEIDDQPQAGFLLYLPVYAALGVPATAAARWRTLRGFALGAFRTGDLLPTLDGALPAGSALEVYDGVIRIPAARLFSSGPSPRTGMIEVRTVMVGGRPWTLVFHAVTPARRATSLLAPAIAVVGALLSLLLFWGARRQARIECQERQLRTEAEDMRARAEQAGELRERLLAIVSHDLRNPLSSIRMGAELLGERRLDPDALRTVQRIMRSSDRMARMIDQLLDFVRLRQGQALTLVHRRLDLGELARSIVDEHRTAHPDRVIELDLLGDLNVEGDQDRLAQVISNLIGNALQHGRGAPVSVRVERGDRVELTVTNHGPSIPPETRARLFEPFARGAGADPAAPGSKSVGLGLYISSQIMQAHGGELRLQSDDVQGTRFTISLQPA